MVWIGSTAPATDVAISAPFGSGAGTVYIYHGSPNQVISAQAQQVSALLKICRYYSITVWHYWDMLVK